MQIHFQNENNVLPPSENSRNVGELSTIVIFPCSSLVWKRKLENKPMRLSLVAIKTLWCGMCFWDELEKVWLTSRPWIVLLIQNKHTKASWWRVVCIIQSRVTIQYAAAQFLFYTRTISKEEGTMALVSQPLLGLMKSQVTEAETKDRVALALWRQGCAPC